MYSYPFLNNVLNQISENHFFIYLNWDFCFLEFETECRRNKSDLQTSARDKYDIEIT